MLTGFNAMRTIAEHVLTVPPRQGNLDHRFGMTRAMGTLEHPITWGMIASMSVANVFYIYRQRLVMALGRTGFFAFVTFTSLSTGPLLSVLCQLGLIAWDRTLAFFRFRWLLLVYLVLFGILLVRIGGEFQLREVIVNDVSYAKASAETRLVVWDYGLMEVKQHPLFGIGLNDWTKPWWRANEDQLRELLARAGDALRDAVARLPGAGLGGQLRADRDAEDALAGGSGLPAGLPDRPDRSDPRARHHRPVEFQLRAPDDLRRRRRLVLSAAPGEAETRDAAVRSRRAAQARAFGVVPQRRRLAMP